MSLETAPKRDIGVGLISVGWMGRLHSRAYTALPLFYPELGLSPRLIQAADVAEVGRNYAQEVLGYASTTSDYQEVLNNPEVEVVSICSPNSLHAEVAIAAAQAGKSLWLEKPAGRDSQETEAIATAVVQRGVTSCIGFNYRHAPAVQYARELVSSGALGSITNVRGRFFGGFSSNPEDPRAWRFVREASGSGVLNDLMGHLTDLIHYLLGPIAAVTATTGTYITERPPMPGQGAGQLPVENEDYATMLIRFHDAAVAAGALGSLEASRIAVGPRSEYHVEIFGTEGSLHWDFERMNELQLAVGREEKHRGYTRVFANEYFPEYSRFQPSSGTSMGYDDLKIMEAARFLAAVTGQNLAAQGGGTQDAGTSNIFDAVAAAQVNSAAEESASTGSWVQLLPVPQSTANTIS